MGITCPFWLKSMATTATATATNSSLGDERRERGRAHFTALLSHLLTDVSHPEMAALADWALNETGCLHTSQLSHLRNAKMRMLGVKSLDALGAINSCAHEFQQDRSGKFRKMGTAQTTARIEEVLARYKPAIHPETGEPLSAGDLMMVYLGYLQIDLPGLDGADEKRWSEAAQNLGAWVEDLMAERGIRMRDGVAQIKQVWTGTDSQRDHFCFAVSGMADFKPEELADSWPHITKAVSSLADETFTEDELMEMVTA